jgi:hypothetical protein
MNVAIYRILHLGAAGWPQHAGDRAGQRASIRSGLLTIRRAKASEGGYVHIGESGASVHYTHPGYGACSLAGYSLTHCHVALAAMVAGVPWVDTRPVRDIGALLRAPMVALARAPDPEPWHGLSHAPLREVFRHYAAAGAHVGNIDLTA